MKKRVKHLIISFFEALDKNGNLILSITWFVIALVPIILWWKLAINWHSWIYNTVNAKGWLVPAPLVLSLMVLMILSTAGVSFLFGYSAIIAWHRRKNRLAWE